MSGTSLNRVVRLAPRGLECGTQLEAVDDGIVICGAEAIVRIAFDGKNRPFDELDDVLDLCQCRECYNNSRHKTDPLLSDLLNG